MNLSPKENYIVVTCSAYNPTRILSKLFLFFLLFEGLLRCGKQIFCHLFSVIHPLIHCYYLTHSVITMNETTPQKNTTPHHAINTNKPSSSSVKKEEEDDEGLLMNGYDIVIVGTGITQSILSCALSLAGKSVLHCDANDYYGGSYGSSFDPDSFVKMFGSKSDLEISNDSKNLCNDDDDGVLVLSSSPLIQVHKVTSGSSSYSVKEANYKVGDRLNTVYGEGVVEHVECVVSSTIGFDCICKQRIRLSYGILYQSRTLVGGWNEPFMQYKKRKFIMDTCPKFILNNGPAVRGLVDSGVANYMEFKGVLGVNFAQKEKNGIINIHKVGLTIIFCFCILVFLKVIILFTI